MDIIILYTYITKDTSHRNTSNIDIDTRKTRPIGSPQYTGIVRPRKTMDYTKNNAPIPPIITCW